MAKPLSQRIAGLIEKGLSNKEIIARLKCNPQSVYNTRYAMKQRAKPTAKPKRKYVRKQPVQVVVPPPPTPANLPTEIIESPEVRTPLINSYNEPSLWERIKYWLAIK
jgi:hypothetical protein